MIRYELPAAWIRYDQGAILGPLVEARAVMLALREIPFERGWVEHLQALQLKREVAGTSRIEGAEFTERELDAALKETPEEQLNRSQRQARAAMNTYRWIAAVEDDRPLGRELILEVHRRIVTGADDDHCPPGTLRGPDDNVTFGVPRHRGAAGGVECEQAFARLVEAIGRDFRAHDPLVQALAAHYHIAAIHPFSDGNGRTARAVEALLLQRAGLRDSCFIAMSNYYYDEKNAYLAALSEVRARGYDLTPFLVFGLRGVAAQSRRLLAEIRGQVSKALYRNLVYDLFGRLKSPKRRVIAGRQRRILNLLLEVEAMDLDTLVEKASNIYGTLKSPGTALRRDLLELIHLRAIAAERRGDRVSFRVRLEWPTEITATEFFERIKALPKARTHAFLP